MHSDPTTCFRRDCSGPPRIARSARPEDPAEPGTGESSSPPPRRRTTSTRPHRRQVGALRRSPSRAGPGPTWPRLDPASVVARLALLLLTRLAALARPHLVGDGDGRRVENSAAAATSPVISQRRNSGTRQAATNSPRPPHRRPASSLPCVCSVPGDAELASGQ